MEGPHPPRPTTLEPTLSHLGLLGNSSAACRGEWHSTADTGKGACIIGVVSKESESNTLDRDGTSAIYEYSDYAKGSLIPSKKHLSLAHGVEEMSEPSDVNGAAFVSRDSMVSMLGREEDAGAPGAKVPFISYDAFRAGHCTYIFDEKITITVIDSGASIFVAYEVSLGRDSAVSESNHDSYTSCSGLHFHHSCVCTELAWGYSLNDERVVKSSEST